MKKNYNVELIKDIFGLPFSKHGFKDFVRFFLPLSLSIFFIEEPMILIFLFLVTLFSTSIVGYMSLRKFWNERPRDVHVSEKILPGAGLFSVGMFVMTGITIGIALLVFFRNTHTLASEPWAGIIVYALGLVLLDIVQFVRRRAPLNFEEHLSIAQNDTRMSQRDMIALFLLVFFGVLVFSIPNPTFVSILLLFLFPLFRAYAHHEVEHKKGSVYHSK